MTPAPGLTKTQRWILALLLLLGSIGVVSTYTSLSATDDEGFHVACGMQWWRSGEYTLQPLHPPLARVMDAALPYWLNATFPDWNTPPELRPQQYLRMLVLMRLGTLPFYILSCLIVFAWSRQLFGAETGLWSLALYITLSTVTAHAGLATTDMGYMAALLWALFSAVQWLGKPDARRSIMLGLSLGIAIGTKFSALAHFPAAMLGIVAIKYFIKKRGEDDIKPYLIAMLYILPLTMLVLAAIYHFSLAPLWAGINAARHLSHAGFGAWLYGPLYNHGVWYFFPVVFFFKTPLPFFAAAILGNAWIIRGLRKDASGALTECIFPLCAACAIMLVSMTSHINLGVRHVLPLYPLLAIPAGYGLQRLWRMGADRRIAAAALMLWQIAGFIDAYPEHIAYFNLLAGRHPEHITLDSDYDWGQAMIMLDEVMRRHHVQRIYLCARRDTFWNIAMLTDTPVMRCPKMPVSGWIAVSRAFRLLQSDKFTWLNDYEAVQPIGRTMDLYDIPAE